MGLRTRKCLFVFQQLPDPRIMWTTGSGETLLNIQGSAFALSGCLQKTRWARDVTREGVHPNPGPYQDYMSQNGTTYIQFSEEIEYDYFFHDLVEIVCGWCTCQINGANGEYTGLDDMPKTKTRKQSKDVAETSDHWEEKEVMRQNLHDWYGDGLCPCINAYLGKQCKHSGKRGSICSVQRNSPRARPPSLDTMAESKNDKPMQGKIRVESLLHLFSVIATGVKMEQYTVEPQLYRTISEVSQSPALKEHPDRFIIHSLSAYYASKKLLPSCCSDSDCKGGIQSDPFITITSDHELLLAMLVSGPKVAIKFFNANVQMFARLRRHISINYTQALDAIEQQPLGPDVPDLILFQAASSKFSALYPNIPCCPDCCGADLSSGPCNAPKIRRMKSKPDPEVWDKVTVEDQLQTTTLPRMRVRDYSWKNVITSFAMLAFGLFTWYFPEYVDWHWFLMAMGYMSGVLVATISMTEVEQTYDDPRLPRLIAEVARVVNDKRSVLYANAVGFQKERETFFMPHLISTKTIKRSWLSVTLKNLQCPAWVLHISNKLELRPWFISVCLGMIATPWWKLDHATIVLLCAINGVMAAKRVKLSKHSIMSLTTFLTLNSPEVMSTGSSLVSYRAEVDNATRKLAAVLLPACTVLGMRNGDNIINHTKNVCMISFLAMKNRENWFNHLNEFAPRSSMSASGYLATLVTDIFSGPRLMEIAFLNFQLPCVVAIVILSILDWIRIIMHLTGMTFFLPVAALTSLGLLILVLTHYLLTVLLQVRYIDLQQHLRLPTCFVPASYDDSFNSGGARDFFDEQTQEHLTSTPGLLIRLIQRVRRLLLRFCINETVQDTSGYEPLELRMSYEHSSNLSNSGSAPLIREEMDCSDTQNSSSDLSDSLMMIQENVNSPYTPSSSTSNMASSSSHES